MTRWSSVAEREWEMMFIAKPDVENLDDIIRKFVAVIENNGGRVLKLEKWGKKRLAYEMQGYEDGLYVLITFASNGKAVVELDRVVKLTDEVFRHMIIMKGE